MTLTNACRKVAQHWTYEPDQGGERWCILAPDETGHYRGDCEDFALTVLAERWGRLGLVWALLRGHAAVYSCRSNNGPHVVGWSEGLFFDNWTQRPLFRTEMAAETGHSKFKRENPVRVLWRVYGGGKRGAGVGLSLVGIAAVVAGVVL